MGNEVPPINKFCHKNWDHLKTGLLSFIVYLSFYFNFSQLLTAIQIEEHKIKDILYLNQTTIFIQGSAKLRCSVLQNIHEMIHIKISYGSLHLRKIMNKFHKGVGGQLVFIPLPIFYKKK